MMTLKDLRVQDPILSNIALEYTVRPTIAASLFPFVDVDSYGGKILEFGKEAFRRYNSRRAPGADVKVIDYGRYGTKDFSLETHDLDALVPREHLQEASRIPGIDLATRATKLVLDGMLNEWEDEVAAIAQNPANFPGSTTALAGATQWSTPGADIIGMVSDAREVIRGKIGVYPNRMVVGGKVLAAIGKNTEIIERIKYTQTGLVTTGLLSSLFQIPEIVQGESTRWNETTDVFEDVWGDTVILAYVGSGNDKGAPSFGYTYRLRGHPSVEVPWFDRVKKSWRYGIALHRKPVLTGAIGGYLYTNVLAP